MTHKGDGHRQRLRQRFLTAGLQGFQDYEIVELLLTLATPRKDCKQAAKAAMSRFQTLAAVMEADTSELCKIVGIGHQNVFGIKLVKAVADRYLENRILRTDPLSNAQALFDYLRHSMAGKDRECFRVLYLDAKNRVLASEEPFEGTLTASAVYPREIVKSALAHRAAAVIFAHNHPSGDPEPSAADFAVTRQLVFACMTMGITVHEHLVIGGHTYFSFADNGHIHRMSREFQEDSRKWNGENESR